MFLPLLSEQHSLSLDEACPNYWKIIMFSNSMLRSDQSNFPRENYIFKGSFITLMTSKVKLFIFFNLRTCSGVNQF